MTDKPLVTRGFRGRLRDTDPARLPPGQYVTSDFPVLSAGPTPTSPLARWDFSVYDDDTLLTRWTWAEFLTLPAEDVTTDIHCVTHWSKYDTRWRGVRLDTLFDLAGRRAPFVLATCDGGYTTNLTLEDVLGAKAWVVYQYDGHPIEPEHGGPARLLVPHLYFWKSAKWVRALKLIQQDHPGFWEQRGYHNHADPWKEERYWED
ncbi:molybdopterin-dependent oxidoreductase [Deinococcus pimensis]|uniref:molybdopterin-dependent oxidoreductase n=1 Tax=Deinococcus pimensis TaxID=309888 RepID=UPI000483290C|nr:molybdopterin-dependent oxidoreductase [Deinococcus pimensis]